jgi:hypothetical protein
MKKGSRLSYLPILLIALSAMLYAFAALASDGNADPLKSIIDPLSKVNGFKLLAILAAIVQSIILVLKFLFEKISGLYRLLFMQFLTLVLGVTILRMQGLSWAEALLHSQTTATFQIYFHQLIKQFLKKPKDDYLALNRRRSL